jgi:sortase A
MRDRHGPSQLGTAAQPRTVSRAPARRITLLSGVALMLAGAIALGYVGWQYVGTNVVSHHRQRELTSRLTESWERPSAARAATVPGDAFALLRIPRFGRHYEMPILVGVSEGDLASGVGWFRDTARPGRVGNFVLAAHRVTHGEPFHDFLKLRKGDEVIVETRRDVYTYRLRDNGTDRVVDFSQTWVLDPVPGHPDASPTRATLTLLTCAELFHTDERSVVFGDLVSVQDKATGTRTAVVG